jgi:hypothetical protein
LKKALYPQYINLKVQRTNVFKVFVDYYNFNDTQREALKKELRKRKTEELFDLKESDFKQKR